MRRSPRIRGMAWGLDTLGNWTSYKLDLADDDGAAYADGDYDDFGEYFTDLDQSRTHNKANEITDITEGQDQDAWVTPAYDARGNMTTIPNGSAPTTSKTVVYDAWNRPATVGGTLQYEYRYDGLNRRIRRYQQSTSPNWNVSEFYYNRDWQLLQACTATKSRTGDPLGEPERAETVKEQYVWSERYIDSPVLRDRDADGNAENGLEERLYYLTDANYNVTALVDASGAVQVRYVYDPYGVPTWLKADWSSATWAESKVNKILFQGMYYDIETGLYHVRHRMYHPTLGRWLQRDPLGYVDGMGLYEFATGSPGSVSDPFGLDAEPALNDLPVPQEPQFAITKEMTGNIQKWQSYYDNAVTNQKKPKCPEGWEIEYRPDFGSYRFTEDYRVGSFKWEGGITASTTYVVEVTVPKTAASASVTWRKKTTALVSGTLGVYLS